MTRLAILADIHGNQPALDAVIADMQQFNPDHVIVAGDLINGPPFSRQVMETIAKNNWTAIRGNHEFYLLNHHTQHADPWLKWSQTITWLSGHLGKWRDVIAAMPDELTLQYGDNPLIRVVHGLPHDNMHTITPITPFETARQHLAMVQEPIIIMGHYHVAFERTVDRWHIVNPGPVGVVCDGIRKAHYALLDGDGQSWQATFRSVDYDFERVRAGFLDVLDDLGALGLLSLKQVEHARPLVNACFRWRNATQPDRKVDMDLAHEFLRMDSNIAWDYFGDSYHVNRELMPPNFA